MSERYPMFKVVPGYFSPVNAKKKLRLGGYGELDPPHVELSLLNDTIWSDAPHVERYRLYVGELLLELPKPVNFQNVLKGVEKMDAGHTVKLPEPSAPQAPLAVEPADELALESSSPEIEAAQLSDLLPSVEELNRMNRNDLQSLAERLNVWNQIEPTDGSYRDKASILSKLIEFKQA